MAYRFTNTDKWNDSWFLDLKPMKKLLFLYLCDQCDIAGIIEINIKKISFDLGIGKQEVENALKGLNDKIIFSKDEKYLFIKNFLKHQKNYPFNEKATTYKKIIECLENKMQYFDFQSINNYFDRVYIPYIYPNGNSISSSNNNLDDFVKPEERENSEKNWKNDFEIFKSELREEFKKLLSDEKYIAERQKYHPNLNIELTLEKACKDFWATEAGWKNKKSSKSEKIDWKKTFNYALTQKCNAVYLTKNDFDVKPTKTVPYV